MRMWLRILLCVVAICAVLCTISPKAKEKKTRPKTTETKPPPNTASASSPGQISAEELTIQAMLMQNISSVSEPERHFPNTILGYVTPWNNRGYDFAKQLAKFDIIVPVWYQIKKMSGKSEITGKRSSRDLILQNFHILPTQSIVWQI